MKARMWLSVGLLFTLAVLAFRFAPEHIPNVVPLGSLALWAGFYLGKRTATVLMLAVLAISNYILGWYDWRIMSVVCGATLLYVLLGSAACSLARNGWRKYAGAFTGAVLGSVWFFLLTNGAVWLFGNWYPKTIAGLDSCFVAGLPFWRNSLIADLYGVAAFFGLSTIMALRPFRPGLPAVRQEDFLRI